MQPVWPTSEAADETGSEAGALVNPLTIFGLFAVTAMLVFYTLEDRGPAFILAQMPATLPATKNALVPQ